MKTNDADWVEDVRRWYFNGSRSAPEAAPRPVSQATDFGSPDIGYEAAHPSLESAVWSKPAPSRFGSQP